VERFAILLVLATVNSGKYWQRFLFGR